MACAALTYSEVSRCWSIQDVTIWLNQAGFAKYAQQFQDSYIDGRKLLELDDSCLKDRMKIAPGDRRKLLEKLNNLKCQLVDDSDHGAPATPENDFSDGDEGNMDENDDGDDLEYEVPPDGDSDGEVCYSEPDDDLKPQKRPGLASAQPAKPALPQKTAPMVKPPAPVPKPAVNPKPSPTSWSKPKVADTDFARSTSPGSSSVAPPARPPKTAKVLQVSGPGRDFVPEPNATVSASRQRDKAPSDRVSRGDTSAASRPLPSAPAFMSLPPKPQAAVKGNKASTNDDDDDDDGDDGDDYLEPGEPDDDLPGPIQLPEAVSSKHGKKASLDKVDNPQETRPDVRGRGYLPPALDKKAPSRTPSASTGTSAAGAESRSLPPKPNGASPFGKPLPPTPPTELPTVPPQQSKKPSISSTKIGGSSETHVSKGSDDMDMTQKAANEEEEEEEEQEDDEEDEEPGTKSGGGGIRKGLRNGSQKLRNLVHGIGQHLAGIPSKFKEKPKKTPDEAERPEEAEQNSSESFNNSTKPGQRPPARLPAPVVKPPATRPPPLPAKPAPNHADAADAASESGSDSGSIAHRGRSLPQPPVPGGRESRGAPPQPMLPTNPLSRLKIVAEQPPTLEKQPWFKSSMDRKEAIAYLQGLRKDGAFVVRNSSKGPDSNEPYSLSAYYQRVYHLLIRRKPNNRFALGTEKPDELTFATVIEMIEHHKKNPINLASADGQEAATTVLTTV